VTVADSARRMDVWLRGLSRLLGCVASPDGRVFVASSEIRRSLDFNSSKRASMDLTRGNLRCVL
jgi:hypothetical protein